MDNSNIAELRGFKRRGLWTIYIFCKKETRKIHTGNIFSYEAVTWLIDKKACYRGRYMNINTHVDGSQSFDIMGKKMYPRPVKTMRVYRNKRRVG